MKPNRRTFLAILLLVLTALGPLSAAAVEREYQRIVVLTDLHLPGTNLPAKEQVIADINRWSDVDLVAVTGDIVATAGTVEEYAFAKRFFARLNKPVCFTGGNHEYIYPDSFPLDPKNGRHIKEASPERRAEKLRRFQEAWQLPSLFYSRRLGEYLLVFLSIDSLTGEESARMSPGQLAWLRTELAANRQRPTLIFYHAPLVGTGTGHDDASYRDDPKMFGYAQPDAELRTILRDNPQVFLWVAGHVHLAATNEDFASPINLYDGRVRVIHNPNLTGSNRLHREDEKNTQHQELWTNSLFLYPDRVVVRTYDHRQAAWLTPLDRTIPRPQAVPLEVTSPTCEPVAPGRQ